MSEDINYTKEIFELGKNVATLCADQKQLIKKLDDHIVEWKKSKADEHEKRNILAGAVQMHDVEFINIKERIKGLEDTFEIMKKFLNFNKITAWNIIKWLIMFAIGVIAVYNFSVIKYIVADVQLSKQAIYGVNYEKSND